jgi:UDPglucose 6-dehydrogenase
LDSRIGSRFLSAGIGWGGSCFGKDTSALIATASEYGVNMPIAAAARTVNHRQRERAVEKLLGELKILKGRTIGLLGLAFKPNTDDLREAPAIDIARRLIERGVRVKAHDPVASARFKSEYPDLEVEICDTALEVAADVDAIVLVTEWTEYLHLDWDALGRTMRQRIVLDGRYALDRERLIRSGFRYLSMCS